MIYLQEIFDKLAYGEFSSLSAAQSPVGSVKRDEYPRLVFLINSGLYDIYKRLVIKKKEFDLYQRAGYEKYYLQPQHVGNPNSGDPNVYIAGSNDNLLDEHGGNIIDGDIIKLLEAFDSTGEEIFINNKKYPDDIFLPEDDVIKIIERDPLAVISVVYQASYPRIVITSAFDPASYKMYIPRYILKALTSHVASAWFTGKAANVAEGQPSLATSFRYAYESAVAEIEQLMLVSQEEEESLQFSNSGMA